MLKILSLAFLLIAPLWGEITAQQIMATARYATTLHNMEFKGKIKGERSTAILLKMLGNDLQLWYYKDTTTKGIKVLLEQDKSTIYDVTGNQANKLDPKFFGSYVENTDFTYEDISMRFLYWSHPQIHGEDTIKTRKCYKVKVFNPTQSGNYKFAFLWIEKNSFAVMKMEGYDFNEKHIKTLEATDVMNVDDKIVLKKMKVKTIENGRTKSQSYLILENPEGVKRVGPKKFK